MDSFVLIRELPLQNAIKVGALYFKPKDLEAHTSLFVRPLTLEAEGFSDYLSLRGTCTLLRLKGKLYVIATRHQFEIAAGGTISTVRLEQARFVALSGDGILKNIPVNEVRFVDGDEDEEFHDLLAFRVDEAWKEKTLETPYFFPLDSLANGTAHVTWAVGFPTKLNEMRYDPQHYFSTRVVLGCKADLTSRTNVMWLRRYEYENSSRDVDGMSGGSVYSVVGEFGRYELKLEGVILRGGAGYLYAIDAEFLRRFLCAF